MPLASREDGKKICENQWNLRFIFSVVFVFSVFYVVKISRFASK